MTKTEVVDKLFGAVESDDFEKAASLMADDFKAKGGNYPEMSKEEWLDFMKKLKEGFPDLKFNFHDYNESGDNVNATSHVVGTNTEDLPALRSGMETISATGVKAENPDEDQLLIVKDDLVYYLQSEGLPNAGVTGFLRQIGVNIPETQS